MNEIIKNFMKPEMIATLGVPAFLLIIYTGFLFWMIASKFKRLEDDMEDLKDDGKLTRDEMKKLDGSLRDMAEEMRNSVEVQKQLLAIEIMKARERFPKVADKLEGLANGKDPFTKIIKEMTSNA